MHYRLKSDDDSIRNKVWRVSRAGERARENKKLRYFLRFRVTNWQSNKMNPPVNMGPQVIPPHLSVSATTIPNLVLIYQVHLTSGKVPKKEAFIMKNDIFQDQFTL